MSRVAVSGISKSFGATAVLGGIDLAFADGGFTSLLGPSGSGKTTLLRIIGGFIPPDRGQVTIGGEDVTAVPLWKRNIGMVFQSYALFPHMTVAENVGYGLKRRGLPTAEIRRAVGEVLDLVHLAGFDARRPKQLSGGQQQRVALARAIVTKPRVLLLDEPLSALDRRLRQNMQIELRRIQRDSGLTTIFVTHDQEEALTLSDRVAILDKGTIVQEGTPTEVYERPKTVFAAGFLGDANLFRGTVVAGGVSVLGALMRTEAALPAVGTAVTLAVRPEKIEVRDPGAGDNGLSATVEAVIYAGSVSTLLLRGPSGEELKVVAQNRSVTVPEPNETIAISWSPAHTVVLEN